jgi:tetratricopeptide (TPR) repeat protein
MTKATEQPWHYRWEKPSDLAVIADPTAAPTNEPLTCDSLAAEVAEQPNSSQTCALTSRALQMIAGDRMDLAMDLLESQSERSADGHLLLSFLLLQQHRFEDAANLLISALEKHPQEPFLRYNLGVAFYRTGRAKEAIAQLRSFPESDEPALKKLFQDRRRLLAASLLEAGILHEAKAELDWQLKHFPDDTAALSLMTEYLLQVNDLEAAKSLWQSRLSSSESCSDALMTLLGLALEVDDRVAIEEFRARLTQISPRSLLADKLLITAALHLADFSTALELSGKTAEREPSFLLWHNRGFAAQQCSEWSQAELAYDQALSIGFDTAETKLNAAFVATRRANFAKAEELLQSAANDSNALAAWNLALLHDERGDFAKAENYYREVVALFSDWPEAWYLLGIVQLRQSKPEEAVEALRQAAKLRSDWPLVRIALAATWEELGQEAAAKQAAQEALEQNPPEELRTALQKLVHRFASA